VNASSTGSTDPSPHRLPLGPGTFTGSPSDGATTRSGRRRRWVIALAIGAPLALAGCNAYPSYGASSGVTKQGHETFKLWSGMMTAGIVVFVLVGAMILWSVFRYRRTSDKMPKQFHEHGPIEVVYTVIPILIVGVLFFFTVLTENNVDATVPASVTTVGTDPVVDVTVTAFQWGWRFAYPHYNVDVVGETTNGPDNHGPQMVVPKGETVQITLVSNDVIHGFYLRDINFSRYAQPGVTNVFDLTFNQLGTFDGQCTQFCGLYHSEMLFTVKSVSPAAFASWTASEVANGDTIKSSGSSAQNNPPSYTRQTPAGTTASASTNSSVTSKTKASA
jgi:cytochrome c oxidase subunit 2